MTQLVPNPPIKWFGGKQPLAKWLQSLAPAGYTHRNIVFGGGLGEFWNWEYEGIAEAVNDTNWLLTNFYNVLKSEFNFAAFRRLCEFTPFSENDFNEAAKSLDSLVAINPDEFNECVVYAHEFFIRCRQSRMGMGRDYATPTKRIRRGMNEQVSAYLSAVEGLEDAHERLRRVEIRNLDFAEFICKYDHHNALFYLDPPYLHETRSSTGEYGPHEMSVGDHGRLLDSLSGIKGKFMLSGYRSDMYDFQAKGYDWNRHDKETTNNASSSKTKEARIECVWTNY